MYERKKKLIQEKKMKALSVSIIIVFIIFFSGARVNAINLGLPFPLDLCPEGSGPCIWDILHLNLDVVKIVLVIPPLDIIDTNFVNQIAKSRAAGLSVFGIIKTNLGKRSIIDIKADIDVYLNLYKVVGVLFDEIPLDCSYSDYYKELYAYVHVNVSGLVILNVNVDVPLCFGILGDILKVFDSSLADYKNFIPAPWMLKYPPNKFWHIVSGVSRKQQRSTIIRSIKKNAGFLYLNADLDVEILGKRHLLSLDLDLLLQLRLLRILDLGVLIDNLHLDVL